MAVKIIAEISGNHGGSLDQAINLIGAAKDCGCDAVKIQMYFPEEMPDQENRSLYETYRIKPEWLDPLFMAAAVAQIEIFASVFSPSAIMQLERLRCPAYKIASPESTRLSIERYVAIVKTIRTTKARFIASSGKQDWNFIQGLKPDRTFYCKAGYPATIDNSDFEMIPYSDGFSDHTVGIRDSIAMMGAGAWEIEKHFKLDDNCIDAAFSINPTEMKLLCDIAHQ